LSQIDESGLGGVIDGGIGAAPHAADGCDIDDCAPLLHFWNGGAQYLKSAAHIDCEFFIKSVVIDGGKRSVVDINAGVVDQEVQRFQLSE
jgi:hypothetical protein